jgi:hypothetical protein
VKQQTGISRRLGSRAAARTFAIRMLGPKPEANSPIEHACLRRLTLELSGHINRKAIDWSA